MTVQINNQIEEPFEYTDLLEKIAIKVLESEGFKTNCEISVSIVDEEEIKDINSQFRGIDKVTDVLSFPQLTFCEDEHMGINESGEIILGDIVICLDKAKKQAEEYGHSLQREVGFLTAHSMLHLLGYDHMEESEEKIMFEKQEIVLTCLDIKR